MEQWMDGIDDTMQNIKIWQFYSSIWTRNKIKKKIKNIFKKIKNLNQIKNYNYEKEYNLQRQTSANMP